MSNILPGLYLGDVWNSEDLDLLKERKITHILVVGIDLEQNYPDAFKYHQIQIHDMTHANLFSHFHVTYQFIEEGLAAGGVLVHCAMGISRSSTIVIAYLMQKNKWDFQTAYQYVMERRPYICPNMGFRRQLKMFEKLNFVVDLEHPETQLFIKDIKTVQEGDEYE